MYLLSTFIILNCTFMFLVYFSSKINFHFLFFAIAFYIWKVLKLDVQFFKYYICYWIFELLFPNNVFSMSVSPLYSASTCTDLGTAVLNIYQFASSALFIFSPNIFLCFQILLYIFLRLLGKFYLHFGKQERQIDMFKTPSWN